ncbi:hypothetical protein ACFQLX_23310 [Streptomyces polyrhachis]|uniref:Uncharacterized protein n=1 Tax=Streptomyces polyrhachis TaxID=1282885 RepID=A0ABW2GK65_9ACTN
MKSQEAELDRDIAALLAARAFTEIRHLTGDAQRVGQDSSPDETLDRIRFLADLGHNLPGVARPRPRKPSRRGKPPRSFDQAINERPMSWVWNTAGPEARAWMLRHIEQAGRTWTQPPPLPAPRKDPSPMTPQQRGSLLLRRWPVKTPAGRQPLPPEANVLKALDIEEICTLHDEARRLRLGLGGNTAWLRAHLATDGVHYLLPDPAHYYWPGTPNSHDGRIDWWQCATLLQMCNGEQVSGMVAVLPEIFAALPSTLPRKDQLRLVHRVRSIERDTYLWGRDHESECAPQFCGYVPEPTDSAPPS